MHHKFLYALCLNSYLISCPAGALEPGDVRLVTRHQHVLNPTVGSDVTWITCAGPGVPSRNMGQWLNIQVPVDRQPELIAAFAGTATGDVDAANRAYAMLISFPHVERYPWNTTNPPNSGSQVTCSPTGGIMVAMQYGNQYSQWVSDSAWRPGAACTLTSRSPQDLGTYSPAELPGATAPVQALISCDSDASVELSFASTGGSQLVAFSGGARGELRLQGQPHPPGVPLRLNVQGGRPLDPQASVVLSDGGVIPTTGTQSGSGILTLNVL